MVIIEERIGLEELEVYRVAMEIGEIVWAVVIKWEYFEKKTLGTQLVDAADSIALNISEGYGRFHYRQWIITVGLSKGNTNCNTKS